VSWLFWISVLGLAIAWVLYPVVVIILSRQFSQDEDKGSCQSFRPSITIIIAAFNEEAAISSRIDNVLSLDGNYTVDILVGSDGSTDSTVEIVKRLGKPNVHCVDFQSNRGRASVHNDCARFARGEILVFTDAESRFDKGFLSRIIPHFGDAKVGVVSGRIAYVKEKASCIGEAAGVYWRYEEAIRVAESQLGVLAFGTGAALAIRRELYVPIGRSEDIDYAETLEVRKRGRRICYETDAVCYDKISETTKGAFKTRIRQTSRAFKSIASRVFAPSLISKCPAVFLSAFLHKTLRHVTPFFMLAALVANTFLVTEGGFYQIMYFCQTVFYVAGIAGFFPVFRDRVPSRLLLPYNFVLLNCSRFIGVVHAIVGKEKASYTTQR
jgi:poly-beta-1,6-N-acetyl-D-glucosamine synthase